ncbi:hypothetical protein JTB14_011681 [Gonioctena quinquepunctata]|nr:hypothetical protein JTB14_011681 [Gonioctena quinquepunctata]
MTLSAIPAEKRVYLSSYSDDTQLKYSFLPQENHIAEYTINADLKMIKSISEKHNIKLNAMKSMYTLFGNKKDRQLENHIELKIDCTPIPHKKTVSSLGLLINDDLIFWSQLNKTTKGAYYSLRILYDNRHVLNRKLKIMLTESL